MRPSIYGRGLKYHFIPAHLNLRSLRNLKTSWLRFSSATTTPPLPQSFSAVIGRPVWFSTNGRSWLAHMTAGLYCGQTGRQAVGLTKLLFLLGSAFFKEKETVLSSTVTRASTSPYAATGHSCHLANWCYITSKVVTIQQPTADPKRTPRGYWVVAKLPPSGLKVFPKWFIVTSHWKGSIGIYEPCLTFYLRPNISVRFTSHFVFVGDKMNICQLDISPTDLRTILSRHTFTHVFNSCSLNMIL